MGSSLDVISRSSPFEVGSVIVVWTSSIAVHDDDDDDDDDEDEDNDDDDDDKDEDEDEDEDDDNDNDDGEVVRPIVLVHSTAPSTNTSSSFQSPPPPFPIARPIAILLSLLPPGTFSHLSFPFVVPFVVVFFVLFVVVFFDVDVRGLFPARLGSTLPARSLSIKFALMPDADNPRPRNSSRNSVIFIDS